MPYQKHNRYISKEQFSEETTIDGSRMDNAMQDVQDLVNAIPKGDLKNRYTQTQFVMGWSPAKTYAANSVDTSLPWMKAKNSENQIAYLTGSSKDTPDAFQNPARAKGYATDGIAPPAIETAGTGAQYIWMTPIHFNKSVIIKSLKLFFMLDTNAGALYPFNNTYQFGVSAPEGFAPNQKTTDLSVQMIVDRPVAYGSEVRLLNQVVGNKVKFVIDDAKINQTTAAPTSDMFPNPYPGGNLHGKYFDVTVNQPLPVESRLRICVVIPDYEAHTAITSTWGATPWLKQYYSGTLTVLEEVER